MRKVNNVENTREMLESCEALRRVKIGSNFTLKEIVNFFCQLRSRAVG